MTGELFNILNQVKVIDYRIQDIKLEINELESCLLPRGIAYDQDKVQSSPKDTMSELVMNINIREDRLHSYEMQLLKAIQEVNELIDILKRPEAQTIMKKRYIGFLGFKEIAKQMNYSEDGVYKIHRVSIKEMEEHLKEKKKSVQ